MDHIVEVVNRTPAIAATKAPDPAHKGLVTDISVTVSKPNGPAPSVTVIPTGVSHTFTVPQGEVLTAK